MRRAATLILVLLTLPAGSALAQSRGLAVERIVPADTVRRLALVVGNADYRTGPLSNPVNDARAMAETLRAVGFEVQKLENATQVELKRAIFAFGRDLRNQGGVGLFYYSGHGMNVNGRNWMIPIGAHVDVQQHAELEGVAADRVLAEMDAADNQLNLVILDACRDNPFARSFRTSTQGLGTMDAPTGTLVAYATAPGRVAADGGGGNSPFTGELVRVMREPGLKVEEVFKRVRVAVKQRTDDQQVPWESSSLTGDFYFVPPETAGPALLGTSPEVAATALTGGAAGSGLGIGWRTLGGGGLLLYGAVAYKEALDLHEEAIDRADSDPARSRELESQQDDALARAASATLLGAGLLLWAWIDTGDEVTEAGLPPPLEPVAILRGSAAPKFGIAANLRW